MRVDGGKRSVIADINVTPMADVMIVLLIIFMVAAPVLTRPPVQLPTAVGALEHKGERVEVVVRATGDVAVGGLTFGSPASFGEWMSARHAGGLRQSVLLQADRNVAYRSVAPVLAACRQAGAEEVVLAAERRGARLEAGQ